MGTLTQRYWECMFSRMVMVGHAPQEFIDFIGYNPVIELNDKISAERLGSWDVRMKWLMGELANLYCVTK